MSERKNATIIAFVGLAGTGKSAVTEYLGQRGFPRVSFGDIVMKAVEEAGLDPTAENERTIREKLRLDPAGDQVATRAIEQLSKLIESGQHSIILDGLGSWDTYKRLKHEFPGNIVIVALTAQRRIRYRRLANRADNPLTEQVIRERDYDEIETLNKGGIMAMADHFVFDNGSLEQLHIQIDDLLRQIEFNDF